MKSQQRNNKNFFSPPVVHGRDAPAAPSASIDKQDHAALRDLITGPEQRKIAEIQKRLDDPVKRAEEISSVLPDAMLLGTARDHRIAEALQPAMDSALKTSVRKNPKALVDAIYPILGPGIRKAVSSILMGMIQSLNRMLDTAFSLRGIKWRLEAFRSRRSFAEVVLLKTLVYKVEQIFLIHRSAGLVLQHVSSPDIASKDPDLVSGMLSAIQDFVTDSFPSETSNSLETLRMGEGLSVMIEQSRDAILAAVIRGTPPMDQRDKFRSMLEEIQKKFGSALETFQGDTTPFVILRNRLEEGLDYRVRTEARRTSPLFWVICTLILFVIGYLIYQPIHTTRQWKEFIQDLKRQPGIVITDYGKEGGRYYVSGLKDLLAPDTGNIQAAYPFESPELTMNWVSYDSHDPELVLKRAEKLLTPPETVQLSFSDSCLAARGSAGHDWVSFFRRRAETLAGVETTNTDGLTDEDEAALDAAAKRLSEVAIFFPKESFIAEAGQEEILTRVVSMIEEIQMLSKRLGTDARIVLIGHTDPSGTEAYNRRLSRDRADAILDDLIEHGVIPSGVTTIGITGKKEALLPKTPKDDAEIKRIVTFETFYTIPERETE